MKLAVRRTTTAFAAVATAGASSLFLGAVPAYAAPTEACGPTGELVAPGICEQTFTEGSAIFTPAAQMTKLEVLLVGAGGAGIDLDVPNTTGYAAGGGGEVKIVDFSGATAPLNLTVPAAGVAGSVSDGTINATVNNGHPGIVDMIGEATGGWSGNLNPGATGAISEGVSAAGGGGAGGAAIGANGGPGVVVNTIAPSGSLFSDDTSCYGGGGAVGAEGFQGLPGCGGGSSDSAGELIVPTPNSGGGGGAGTQGQSVGASGVVVIRWSASDVTLSFDVDGIGTAPAAQSVVAGVTPTQPDDPTAPGYEFDGWFTDAALTSAVDFSTPLTVSTTFYAKWSQVLPATGGAPDLAQLAGGITALVAGAGLVAFAAIRRRREG